MLYRSDIVADILVLIAAGLVFLTQSGLPELVLGSVLPAVFARLAVQVFSQSWQEMR
ncbi:hypothetical protein [cf. Phormidesmis sp. LEGE 11477]|uniref:hypothetical protein n=1 Tax=cf. Phormidesmis sp. LEGE 11477 TaxID=1828680 RepID=UPI001882AB47|nr:hypothetical protein [cf. Phormidesmis sp. LEGE 11477]MBE9062132.1 hypothetical protein [cf. Phormidesmis sp. LEGE 11477]